MKLNRTFRRACVEPVTFITIVAYGLMALYYLRKMPRHEVRDYYPKGMQLAFSQSRKVCGPNGCVTINDGFSSSTSGESWSVPQPGQPWVYSVNGQEVGRIFPDGRITGFPNGLPRWITEDVPAAAQARARNTTVNDRVVVGDAQVDKTGVDRDKLQESKKAVPGGYTMNGVGITEAEWRANLSRGAKMTGFKDYDQLVRVACIGPEDACKAYKKVIDDLPTTTRDRLIYDWYDPSRPEDEHHITQHLKGAQPILKDLKPGKAIAYVQFSDGGTPAVATEPGELSQAIGNLRDANGKFDVNQARVGVKITDDVMGLSLALLILGIPLLIWANRPQQMTQSLPATQQ